jgi:hypothetical protein
MNPVFNLIDTEQFKTSCWSGGKTTEFAIFPPDGSYCERRFYWRLSSAVMACETSAFTHLPGVERHLMVISGSITLIHDSGAAKHLNAFEQDAFYGGATTVCEGTGIDFNLMTMSGCKGFLRHIKCGSNKTVLRTEPDSNDATRTIALYAPFSAFLFSAGPQEIKVAVGSLLTMQISALDMLTYSLSAQNSADIILADTCCPSQEVL